MRILVTGAASGLGAALTRAWRLRGDDVLATDLAGQDVDLTLDITNDDDWATAFEEVQTRWGGLDILVNNAGVAINGLLLRYKDDQWARTLQVNLAGAFHCARAAASLLLRSKEHGRIINITSVVGESGNAGQVAYAASKAGLIGLTQSLAKELSSRGVTANAVSPGFIDTDMTAEHLPEAARGKLLEQIPLARIGLADDVAHAVAFLAGPEAGYITGQVLRVNGGLLM